MRLLAANLIPRQRLVRQRVSLRLRLWSALLGVYVLLVGGAVGVLRSTLGGDAGELRAQLQRAQSDLDAADAELQAARTSLATSTRLLAASRELRDHPDWSALLQSISAIRSEDVVLASVELTPEQARPGAAPSARPSRYALNMTGVARSHSAATAFSLRLEKTGVFSRVSLTDTVAQELNGRNVVSFGLRCTMEELAKDTP